MRSRDCNAATTWSARAKKENAASWRRCLRLTASMLRDIEAINAGVDARLLANPIVADDLSTLAAPSPATAPAPPSRPSIAPCSRSRRTPAPKSLPSGWPCRCSRHAFGSNAPILKRCRVRASALRSGPGRHRAGNRRQDRRDPGVPAVCEPVVFADADDEHSRGERVGRRRPGVVRHHRSRRRSRAGGQSRRDRHGADQQAGARHRRAAVERPHRSAGAPVRRVASRDAVLRGAAQGRADHRARAAAPTCRGC